MDEKRSMLNVSVSVFFRIILLFASIFIRRLLIQYVGNDVNGINSLYLSILGFLSVAELGVGSAITFSMYRPIVEKRVEAVAALYQLFQKAYWIIGSIIFVAGIMLMPALPYLAKDYSTLNINLYTTFFLMLLSVVLSYMFSAKTSLINAYKDNYITTTISSVGAILQYVLQALVLVLTQSFVYYLCCRIVSILLQWIATDVLVQKLHFDIVSCSKKELERESKHEIIKNIKALFMHRIGGLMVNTADSIIISAFIGITVLGRYSNYTIIMTSMIAVIELFFSPLTSIIGHLYATNKEQTKAYFDFFSALNYLIGVVFFLGYYAVIDNLVTVLFGANLEMSKSISFVITTNYFVQFMRQAPLLFRDATGTFYNDRWKPFFEGLLNVILSIVFVLLFEKVFGEEFGVVGVILATIITNLMICHVVEPYVLYKHAFQASPKGFYLKTYLRVVVFVIVLLVLDKCMIQNENQWIELFVNGFISLGLSGVLIIVTLIIEKNFRDYCVGFLKKIQTYLVRKYKR